MPSQKAVAITAKVASFVIVQAAYERFFSNQPDTVVTVDKPSVSVVSDGVSRATVITPMHIDDYLKFRSCVAQWRIERGAMSSISAAALCPAYQTIIGMGPAAISFIIAELAAEGDEPDQWFWALKAITGKDPVPDEDRGDFVAMSKAWAQWAKVNPSLYAW